MLKKGFGDETPTTQIDLEIFFRGFGEIEALRLRRTDTGLFKGSVIVQFKNQSDAEKVLAEPQEWNGSLLDAKTKSAWIQGKKEEDESLTWDERKELNNKQGGNRFRKPFSAFKAMEKEKELAKKQEQKKKGDKRRGGRRDNRNRDRQGSPPPPVQHEQSDVTAVEDAVLGQKRPRPTESIEEAPSLFSNKREKLDDSQAARQASGAD